MRRAARVTPVKSLNQNGKTTKTRLYDYRMDECITWVGPPHLAAALEPRGLYAAARPACRSDNGSLRETPPGGKKLAPIEIIIIAAPPAATIPQGTSVGGV